MKKIFSIIIMCISLLFCSDIMAFAINAPTPNVVAKLTTNLTVAYSENTAGTHKLFGGNNESTSKHDVYFTAQRSSGDKWVTDTEYLVSAGNSIDNKLTFFTGSTVLWRLELNPYGVLTKKCTATGYMWYKM